MSAAQPKTITKPETRRKHRRRSRFTPKPKRQTPLVADKGEDSWYLIRGIVDEKFEKGQTYYLVDWEGTDESGQPHRPSWEPEQNLTIAAVNAWKDSKTFLKPTQNPSDAAVRDSNPSAQESNQAALNQEGGPTQSPSWRRQSCGTKRPREHQAIEESSISEKAPHKRQRTEYSLHTDSSRERDQDLLEVAANEPKHDDQDSSSTTPLSIEEALRLHQIVIELPQNPLFNPSEFFHLSSSSHPTNSQHSSFSIFLPHTSQSQSHDPEIRRDRHQVIPDSQEISQLTSASQSQLSTNNNRTESQLSNSQAAQIVIPFSNHHVELITQDQGRFTVYDDDSIVPDTFQSEDPHIQHNSLASSQALNELDANTRSASFSKDHVSGSFSSRPEGQLQSQSNKASSSLKAQESPTSGQYKDQRSTPRQQAAAENMDGTQPTVRSARDRLRAIREKNLGADLTELPINSVNTNQNGAQGESRTVSDADGQGAQAMEISPPNISPITPTSTVSPAFLTQSVGTAQGETPFNEPSNEPSNEQQSLVPETTQESAKEDPQIESALEESGSAVEYSVPHEEQPATLDPSTLSLSIEHDMEAISYDAIAPSLSAEDEFGPHEEDETPHNYPKSLLPDVPTGRNEYLITLPINNIMRPMYIDILLENEELMKAYNASFLVSPYEQPHPTLVSKIDEMFSRLFDICDLPLFMETIPSMTDIQLAKYLANTNAKFAFVTELLSSLAEAESDKVILILARPGQLIDFLGHVVQASGHGYIRCGSTITRPSKEHPLTVAVSSTEADASSIPEDVDVVIAFDHTYRRELLPASVWERSPLLMVLTSLCSIQHLNMRVSDQMDPLERKNVLVLASAKTMPYIENCDAKTSIGIPKVAQIFAEHITKWPDDDDFDWEPLKVPEDVFEDLHVASSQAMPEPSLAGLGTNQPPDSRKRSHDTDDDETSSKRPRISRVISQPTIVSSVSHISDSLNKLIGDDMCDPSKATLSVSIDKLEALASKIITMEAKLVASRKQADEYRELSDRNNKERDSFAETVERFRVQYMSSLKDQGTYEAKYDKMKKEVETLRLDLDSSREDNAALKEKNNDLQRKLSEAKGFLLDSSNPAVVNLVRLEKELEEAKSKIQYLEKRRASAEKDMDYTKDAYQSASRAAAERQEENRALERQVEELSRKADDNIVKVNGIQVKGEAKALQKLLDQQRSLTHEIKTELSRLTEENRSLKEGRRPTRQNSVPPRSPRLGISSPRNGGRRTGGSSSRGTSPAPPPSGVFETGSATPNRHSHLKESRLG